MSKTWTMQYVTTLLFWSQFTGSLLGEMDESYESLFEATKKLSGKYLDLVELMLEPLARTEVKSYKLIDRTIWEALFREVYAVKLITPTLWSVYQWIVTTSPLVMLHTSCDNIMVNFDHDEKKFQQTEIGHDTLM